MIDQLVSAFQRALPGSQPFFWRTSQRDEVDLLVEGGGRRLPFEIKLSIRRRGPTMPGDCSAA